MVDIHSHILPGLDDGSKSLDESVRMLELAIASGTTDIVATPHADLQYEFKPEVVGEKITELQKAMGGRIRIHRGCDFHLSFDNIQDCLNHPGKYSINHKGYLLIEFSESLIAPTTTEIFHRMQGVGLTPIITHPERNRLLLRKMDQLVKWVEAGVLVQVTGGSILGRFGKSALHSALELLDRGIVHFIASDSHDTEHRTPDLREPYEFIAKRYDTERAEILFVLNPRATLTGDYLAATNFLPSNNRKWYQFW